MMNKKPKKVLGFQPDEYELLELDRIISEFNAEYPSAKLTRTKVLKFLLKYFIENYERYFELGRDKTPEC